MTLRWLRKRDGRKVPFDLRKLADSIGAAARAAGEDARVPAEEIAQIAALFLERHFQDRIPDTRELEDLVEKALLETGHARTAAVYAEGIKARAHTRSETVVLREGVPVAPDGEPLPVPPGEPWSEGRIVAALERRRIEPALAEEIATSVEQRVFALGFKRVPVSLIREIVNAELLERGFSARIGRPSEVTLPSEEIRGLLVASYVRRGTGVLAPAPGGPEAAVGQDVLARFALAEIYPPRVAEAHIDGTLHVQDLGRPFRLTSAAISLEALKARRAAGTAGPRSAGELGLLLARIGDALLALHSRVIGIPYANVLLAPFARGREASALRALRELVRLIPVAGERPVIRFHVAPVPAEIAGVPVLGPRGRRWKATYGELGAECDRCARLLVEAIRDEQTARGACGREGRSPHFGVIAGIADGGSLSLLDGAVAASLERPGLEPARSRGLAAAAEVVRKDQLPRAIAAGAASVVAVNCARCAYLAGRGDEPAFRRAMFAAIDLALEALAAKWSFLESALYRPKLPLWQATDGQSDDERPAVDAASAVQAIALVGFEEALTFLTGDPPSANVAVAGLAAELCRDLGRRLRDEGARRGLRVRLEEPELERGSRRLADLDLTKFETAREILRLSSSGPNDHDLRYGSGLGGALIEALYRPFGSAPFFEGPNLRARVERWVVERGATSQAAPAAPQTLLVEGRSR